jgi:type III restriction enzyme
VLHHRLPEHRHLETRLRLHLGFYRKSEDGTSKLEHGRLPLFSNFDETTGNSLPRPNTLLIDSEQLEAGDALDDSFRAMAADEIERFRREIVERTGDAQAGANLADQELLREVMNTVGKAGTLGGSIRCVVSVSMLTEGWDANTVTHVLAFARSALSFCASRSSAALSAASPTS